MKYLLDTNICIYLMKNQPEAVQARFAQCFYGDVGISAITLAELRHGVEVSAERRHHNNEALAALLEDLIVAPFNDEAATAYGILRANIKHQQKHKDALDKLIASHAIALQATLVTNNEKDFLRYPGIAMENWIHPCQ